LRLEPLEERCLLAGDFRTIDGSNNNVAHPSWGQTYTDFLRLSPAAYSDGSSAPAGANRPSARVVSNVIADQGDTNTPNDRGLSGMIYVFGQFLDHDTDLIEPATYENGQYCCPFPIPVPKGDPYFDPNGTGTQQIDFYRSKWDPYTGYSQSNPRQQPNEITAWIDASMVYGSDPTRAAALRTFSGGRLKTSAGNLLPFNTLGLPNQNDGPLPDDSMFLAGDIRANENIQLTAMQTLFVREHNWWADQIHYTHQLLSDETVYQLARQIVGAEIQVITYKEFLPALLGPGALPAYTGYKPAVNGSISNEFATSAFRFGHSTLNNVVPRLDNNGKVIPEGNLDLTNAFFNPTLLDPSLPNHEGDIDPLLKGAATIQAQEIDTLVVGDVRNFLFGPPGSGGFDLDALNIQRGRDHGLADYNTMRQYFGLSKVTSFAQITSNVAVQQELQSLYGTVDNIDAYVGGLAEDHVAGGSVGPLFRAILVDQFTRLRDGDRYWYQNVFTGTQLYYLENDSLAQIIRRNTSITKLQPNVFFTRRLPSGPGATGGPPPVAGLSDVPLAPPQRPASGGAAVNNTPRLAAPAERVGVAPTRSPGVPGPGAASLHRPPLSVTADVLAADPLFVAW
jgi:hypothetical protein